MESSLQAAKPNFLIVIGVLTAIVCVATSATCATGIISDVPEAKNLLIQASHIAAKINDKWHINEQHALERIALAQINIQALEDAFNTLSLIKEGDKDQILIAIAKAQTQIGDVKAAQQTAKMFRSGINQSHALAAIAAAQAQSANVDAALKTASLIDPKTSGYEIAYQQISRAQIADGNLDSALVTASPIMDITPYALWGAMNDLVSIGNLDSARQLASKIPDPYQKGYALEGLVVAQLQTGDIQGALHTAASIEAGHPQASALKAIADKQLKTGDSSAARHTLQDAIQATTRITNSGDIAKSDILWRIAATQAAAGDLNGAKVTAAAIKTEAHKAFAFHDIARAQIARGDIEGARKTIKQIAEEPISQSNTRSVAELDIAGAQVKAGHLSDAKATVDSLNKEYRQTGLGTIARVQAETGDFTGAMETVAAIKDTDVKSSTLHEIAQAQTNAGDFKGAVQTVALIPDQEPQWQKFDTLRDISRARVKTTNAKEVLAWANTITNPLEHSAALLGIAEGLIKENHSLPHITAP
ncbi:MAG: hypothetical protein HY208_05360 [Nitrospirae bacterium]|nr:hypothetical protein [Nitrospirota bacterium]